MEVIGKLKVIDEIKVVGASGFKKRDVVVETAETYPQFISVSFTQDKCDLVNSFKLGEEVKISINLRGREWVNPQGETKYFNDISGWRIEKVGNTQTPSNQSPNVNTSNVAPPSFENDAFATDSAVNANDSEDLPF